MFWVCFLMCVTYQNSSVDTVANMVCVLLWVLYCIAKGVEHRSQLYSAVNGSYPLFCIQRAAYLLVNTSLGKIKIKQEVVLKTSMFKTSLLKAPGTPLQGKVLHFLALSLFHLIFLVLRI